MAPLKAKVYEELFNELANDSEAVAEIDQILKLMCDYFTTDELFGFLEFVKLEKEP